MGLIWPALAAITLWALVRLGRQGERAGRGQWRIAATILGAVLMAAALLAGARGAWLPAASLAAGGLYLIVSSRIRPAPGRRAAPVDGIGLSEARRVLGVDDKASPEAIQAAWRRLMARAHPDQGGSEGLAERLNAARDRLLKG